MSTHNICFLLRNKKISELFGLKKKCFVFGASYIWERAAEPASRILDENMKVEKFKN